MSAFAPRGYDFAAAAPALNYIDGAQVAAASGETQAVTNPRHGRELGRVAISGADDVASAVAAAKRAFPGWRATPYKERAQVLYRLKALLERDLDALSWVVSHENGKTFSESVASVKKGIECLEMGASLPNLSAGQQIDVSRGVNCRVDYEPLGVCAGIAPFNFPVMVPMWMLPQAIVGGNAFIIKPSEQVPLSMQRLAALFKEAGLPDGILNVVNGGREAVEALAVAPDIAALAFVGSTAVARNVYERGAATGKRLLCLGGAKNHLIVVPDADVELTARNVVDSFTGCAGQRCMAASVMLGVGDVDHILDEVVQSAAGIRVGEDMGPVTSQHSMERINAYIDAAVAAGARVLVDGRGQRATDGGYWVGPTILDGVRPEMPVGSEEVFGPVLSVIRVDSLDQAIAVENGSEYGNASSVYTTSGEVAREVMERVSAGMCGVNVGVPVPREPFGFGGWNNSLFGHGNLTGRDGFRFWTRPRKITSKWASQRDQTWMS